MPAKEKSPSADISAAIHQFSSEEEKRRHLQLEAAVCALKMELRDFTDILEFHPECALDKSRGRNRERIDLLVIKPLPSQSVPKNIARCFRTYNLFGITDIHSSITVGTYYKMIGYAALFFADKLNGPAQCARSDISITLLGFQYPEELIQLLQRNVNFSFEKSSPGIYYIHNETFEIQIIVTCELPPEENPYLHRLISENLQ